MAEFKLFYKISNYLVIVSFLFGTLLISLGISQFSDMEAMMYQNSNPEMFTFQNVCYKDIGCFYNGPPYFDPKSRPFSVPPQECENTTFPLYTPSNPKKSYNLSLSSDSVDNSPYRCDLPTIFISHGFLTDNKDFRKMKNKILDVGDYNVIVPNYPMYVSPPYFRAVANIRAIGARVGILIGLLMDHCNDKDASRFHLIGHSLGAHMSGYASKYINQQIYRISGLDCAGPYFQDAPNETKLNADDAYFVDIIHTNAARNVIEGGFGIYEKIGHMDFWVNNGYSQPGCDPIKNIVRDKGINFTHDFVSFGCSHSRATDLYTESVKSRDCVFRGVKCDSYFEFRLSGCPEKTSKTAEMGFYAEKIDDVPPGSTFYLETNAYKSFCKKDGTKPDDSNDILLKAYNFFFGNN